MSLLGRRQNCLQWTFTLLISVLGLNSHVKGVKQELWIYFKGGNEALYFGFGTHAPDLTKYDLLFPDVDRYCAVGMWSTFSTVNYQTYIATLGLGTEDKYCSSYRLNVTNMKSLRHWASNEPSNAAVSLYSGGNFNGEEILVTAQAKTDISTKIGSLAASGSVDWTLFEGKNLDGKSLCYKVPDPENITYVFSRNRLNDASVNMTTIGSIFKGCDEREIQLYRKSHYLCQ